MGGKKWTRVGARSGAGWEVRSGPGWEARSGLGWEARSELGWETRSGPPGWEGGR